MLWILLILLPRLLRLGLGLLLLLLRVERDISRATEEAGISTGLLL